MGVAIAAAAAFLWFNEARPDLPTAGDAPAVAAQRSTATSPPASTGAASAGASSATAEAAKATEEAAPAAEAQRFVLLQITSEPSGASIVIDGASQGRTPAQLEWNAPPAGQDQEITITLRRAGFRTAEVRRTMKGERLDVHATLSRTRRAKPARPAPSDKPSIDPW